MPTDNTAAVIALLVILVPSIYVLVRVFARFANLRLSKTERALNDAQAVSGERLRVEALPPVIKQAVRVLYIGETESDQMPIANGFRDAGIENKLVMVDSLQSGIAQLKQTADKTIVIVYVLDPSKGKRFMAMMNADEATRGTDVVFIDGGSAGGKLEAFNLGALGYLTAPLDMSALLNILSRHGFNATLDQN